MFSVCGNYDNYSEAYESYKADFIREPEAVRRLRQLQQHQQGEGAACTIGDRCTLLTTSPSAESSLASNREDFNFGTPHSGSSQLSPSISLAVVKDHVRLLMHWQYLTE